MNSFWKVKLNLKLKKLLRLPDRSGKIFGLIFLLKIYLSYLQLYLSQNN